MAHNFQGYDSYFVLQYLRKQGVKYNVIMCGAKVLSLKVELFDIRFIDSLNFLPMKLASLPKTFGIEELAKGYFPHFFIKKENENYVGPISPVTYYNPDGMNPKDREAFMAWHATKKESNYVFNFKEELITYCRSNVDILRRCCMEFRELLYNVTDIDPFRTLTIASACHLVYRTNYLLKDTIGIIPPMGYTPKNMFIGSPYNLKNRIGESRVFFGDKQVPVTHSFESLGVEIDENLTWEKHIAKICKKASANIGAIKRVKPYVDTSTFNTY